MSSLPCTTTEIYTKIKIWLIRHMSSLPYTTTEIYTKIKIWLIRHMSLIREKTAGSKAPTKDLDWVTYEATAYESRLCYSLNNGLDWFRPNPWKRLQQYSARRSWWDWCGCLRGTELEDLNLHHGIVKELHIQRKPSVWEEYYSHGGWSTAGLRGCWVAVRCYLILDNSSPFPPLLKHQLVSPRKSRLCGMTAQNFTEWIIFSHALDPHPNPQRRLTKTSHCYSSITAS